MHGLVNGINECTQEVQVGEITDAITRIGTDAHELERSVERLYEILSPILSKTPELTNDESKRSTKTDLGNILYSYDDKFILNIRRINKIIDKLEL